VLGRGGQAIACSATILNASECSTRRVAAKEMKARPQDVPHLLARMQVCQGFAHENLARVLAVWQVAHDTYAIAMELCPGTLYDVMQMLRSAQRLPCYRFVREVLRGQLAALAYMQSRGFVHRDVKPQNIAFDLCADFDAEYPEVAKGITLTGSARAREIMCFLAEEWPTPSRADALPPFEVKLIDFDWGRPVGDLTPSGCLATAASANPGTRIFRPDQLPAGASVLDFYRGDIYSAAATAICCAEIVHPSTTVAPEEMQSAEHFAAKCKGPWLERGYPVEFFELVVDMMSSHPAVRPDAPTALRRLMEIPLS
jgi:serine/threonine protein kinase